MRQFFKLSTCLACLVLLSTTARSETTINVTYSPRLVPNLTIPEPDYSEGGITATFTAGATIELAVPDPTLIRRSNRSFAYTFAWDETEVKIATFIDAFLEAAADYEGTDDAVPFLLWVVQRAAPFAEDKAKSALGTLLDAHVKSERLAEMGLMLPHLSDMLGEKTAQDACQRLEAGSSSASLRGWAAYARLSGVLTTASPDSKEYLAAKKEVLAKVEAAGDSDLSETVKSSMRERELFGIGRTAPDIEGIDLDGEAFKLSDYKGKIIFLDFWGDW